LVRSLRSRHQFPTAFTKSPPDSPFPPLSGDAASRPGFASPLG